MKFGSRSFAPRLPVDSAAIERGPPSLTAEDMRRFHLWCRRWTATLCRLRGRFDGDLDQYLLLLVFIHAEVARTLGGLERRGRGEAGGADPRGVNALSVSEICQVPRETTRRKLAALVRKGFLIVREDGLFYLADRYSLPEALTDLAPLMAPANDGGWRMGAREKNGGDGGTVAAR